MLPDTTMPFACQNASMPRRSSILALYRRVWLNCAPPWSLVRSMLGITALVLPILSAAGLATPGGAEQARPPAETELPSRAATVRWIPRSSAAGELALMARIEFARPLRGGDLSVTALYTSATWTWGALPNADLFDHRDARRVFRVVNAVLGRHS